MLGGCLLLALVLRAPYLATALGRDEAASRSSRATGRAVTDRSTPACACSGRPPLALVAVVARLGHEVAGQRAGLIAGLLAALLTGSVAIGAVFTPAELLAAVPSTLSVLCLVRAHRGRRAGLLLAAGALAAGAVLIKQSFLVGAAVVTTPASRAPIRTRGA